jgi:regulator of replication initiation timing
VLNFEERIGALKSELQKSKLLATSKTNEVFLLTSETKKLQEKLELGSQAYTNQINALQVPYGLTLPNVLTVY